MECVININVEFPKLFYFNLLFHSTGRLLNLTNVTYNDAGNYTCEISSAEGALLTGDVLVEVVGELAYWPGKCISL